MLIDSIIRILLTNFHAVFMRFYKLFILSQNSVFYMFLPDMDQTILLGASKN